MQSQKHFYITVHYVYMYIHLLAAFSLFSRDKNPLKHIFLQMPICRVCKTSSNFERWTNLKIIPDTELT